MAELNTLLQGTIALGLLLAVFVLPAILAHEYRRRSARHLPSEP